MSTPTESMFDASRTSIGILAALRIEELSLELLEPLGDLPARDTTRQFRLLEDRSPRSEASPPEDVESRWDVVLDEADGAAKLAQAS